MWKLFRRKKTAEPPTESPYLSELLHQDTHEHDQIRMRRTLQVGLGGLFVLTSGSLYGNLWQMQQAREFHHFVMIDSQYQYVQTLTRRADLMPDTDPIKTGIMAAFVKQYVMNSRQRIIDQPFLLDSLNAALGQTNGAASVKLKQIVATTNPFKQIERERTVVTVEGAPVRVSTNTWLANWTERHETAGGELIREEKKNGHFSVAQDPKRVSPDNVFGLVILDTEEQ